MKAEAARREDSGEAPAALVGVAGVGAPLLAVEHVLVFVPPLAELQSRRVAPLGVGALHLVAVGFPFVEAADIILFAGLSVVEDGIDGPCVVFHEEPVADVLAFSVDGQRFLMKDIVDHQRDQFLGKMM